MINHEAASQVRIPLVGATHEEARMIMRRHERERKTDPLSCPTKSRWESLIQLSKQDVLVKSRTNELTK